MNRIDTALFEVAVEDEVSASLLADVLWRAGVQAIEEVPGETHILLRSSFGVGPQETSEILESLVDGWRVLSVEVRLVDASVSESWKSFVQPIDISNSLTVVPAWLDTNPATDDGRVRISIDPGPTFGMGDHPTTRGSLVVIERLIRPNMEILDVGCGSGILGVAALVLGAGRAMGVDINPAAVQISRENAARNSVSEKWQVTLSELDRIEGTYDIVVANILAPVLIELAPNLVRLVSRDGSLVISGVLSGRYEHVVRSLAPLKVVESIEIDGWTTLVTAF